MESKRNEQNKKWWQNHPEFKKKSSMKRRKVDHDYRGRCIYMLTLVVDGRKPLLGEICGADENHPMPWLKPSKLGRKVLHLWMETWKRQSQIKIMKVQLMPDHLHGIVFVTEPMPKHLGLIVSAFTNSCNKITLSTLGTKLWEPGYNDSILFRKRQLKTMINYLKVNPYRLWMKRNKPEYFTIQRNLDIAGHQVAIAGNRFLLDHPMKVAVKCSRSINTKDAITHEVERYLELARNGAVLISPNISPCEKAVMRAAFDAGLPEIVVLENGFSRMWKPGGAQFDACANGQILFVAPWPHHNERKVITRQQCNTMNAIAAAIVTYKPDGL